MGKSKKMGDRMMEFALRSLLSESNGAIHSEELSPYFERLSASFDALIAVDPLAGTTARTDNRTTSINTFNDRLIINVALYWYRKMNRPCSCVLVTRDKNAMETASTEKLPVINLNDLDNSLSELDLHQKKWTSSLLRKSSLSAFFMKDGTPLEEPAPPPRTLVDDLSSAIHVIETLLKDMNTLLTERKSESRS